MDNIVDKINNNYNNNTSSPNKNNNITTTTTTLSPLSSPNKIKHHPQQQQQSQPQHFNTNSNNDIISSREQKQHNIEQREFEQKFNNLDIIYDDEEFINSNNNDNYHDNDKKQEGEILEKDSTNIFVKHLPNDFNDDDLANLFSKYGSVVSSKVMIDPKGNSYGYGFVRFSNPSESQAAIKELDGFQFQNKKLLCRLSNLYTNLNSKNPSNNLFIKPLPSDVTDDQLRKLFEPFGRIIECKVMLDHNGQSKFAGFVRFYSEIEAAKAIESMNGVKINKDSYPLVVKYADTEQQKISRKQRKLQTVYQEKIITPPIFPQHFLQQNPNHPHTIIDNRADHQSSGYYNYMDYVYLQYHPEYASPAPYYSQPIQIYHHPHQGTPIYSIFPTSNYAGNYYIQQSELHPQHIAPTNSNSTSPVISTIQYSTNNITTTNVNTNKSIKNSGGISNTSSKKKKKKNHQQSQLQHSNQNHISASTPLNTSSSSISSSSFGSPPSPSSISSINESNNNSPPYHSNKQTTSTSTSNSTASTSTANPKVIPNDTNLFVFHLPPFIDDAYLCQLFQQYGKLQSVRVITDKDTGENKGYGFVKFFNKEDAIKCQKEMNGFRIGSKYLKVKLKNPTSIEKDIALLENNNNSNNSNHNSNHNNNNNSNNNNNNSNSNNNNIINNNDNIITN